MDISTLEQVIACSLSYADHERKEEATSYLDKLRSSPERWSLGLTLFFESQSQTAQFFGLSLLRGYLSSVDSFSFPDHRFNIREGMMTWLNTSFLENGQTEIPSYIINNVVSVVTLCLKQDYPEHWPSAFQDILRLTSQSPSANLPPGRVLRAIDLITRILAELDMEVIVFNDQRTKQEVQHNVIIKDTMRATGVVQNLVDFLCHSAVNCTAAAGQDSISVAENCLACLAPLIGWIDITLVVQNALPTIFSAIQDQRLAKVACKCLWEVVKKGMDPVPKVQLINATGLMQVLSSVATALSAPRNDANIAFLAEYGAVMDILFSELLGFWLKFEEVEIIHYQAGAAPSELFNLAPVVSSMLQQSLEIILQLLSYPILEVYSSVFESLNKFISLAKQQQSSQGLIDIAKQQKCQHLNYFTAFNFLNPLLSQLFSRIQYPMDFSFSEDDEDEMITEEANQSVKKLFVNCARYYPDNCLQLIAAGFSSLPSPISSAPFPAVHGALNLLYYFAEGGHQNFRFLAESPYASLLTALHHSDVAMHSHPKVVLAYYDICARYCKHFDESTIQKIIELMVGPRGLRHFDQSVRSRTAYLIFRIADSLDGKASILLPVIGSFADIMLFELGRPSFLTPTAELHLLDTIGLITSSTYRGMEQPQLRQQQYELLSTIISVISGQIQTITTSSPEMLALYVDELGEVLSMKINSFSNLSLGHNFKAKEQQQGNVGPLFQAAATAVSQALSVMGSLAVVRSKAVMFIHRMVKTLGPQCIEIMLGTVGILLAQSDSKDVEEVVQLLNQGMIEFGPSAIPLIDCFFGPVIEKLNNLFIAFDNFHASAASSGGDGTSGGVGLEAPHVEVERAALQRLYVVFIYHVVSNPTVPILSSPKHSCFLQDIFENILSGLQGGKGKIGPALSLPIRKSAVGIVTALVKVWGSSESASFVSPGLRQAMYQFLYDRAVPTVLRSLTDRVSVNVRDAMTQSLLVEVGVLVWTMHAVNAADTIAYLQQLLPALGWPPASCMSLIASLSLPVHAFKESFKQFVRDLMS